MKLDMEAFISQGINFVLLGEAGGGKSEVGVNLALTLAKYGEKPVHFFDMDMTKPLFRSRDVREKLEEGGVTFHCEQQFMDAPTQVGGVEICLRDPDSYVVMDVGGDYIGARAIGGYAALLNREDTIPYYVVNAYRPWSDTIEHIDETLGKILGMSHVELQKLRIVSNPNNGLTTTAEEFLSGHRRTKELLSPYIPVEFACVREELFDEVNGKAEEPVFPIRLMLTYPWLQAELSETEKEVF